jgi:hypothetical protein
MLRPIDVYDDTPVIWKKKQKIHPLPWESGPMTQQFTTAGS